MCAFSYHYKGPFLNMVLSVKKKKKKAKIPTNNVTSLKELGDGPITQTRQKELEPE